MSDSPSYPTLTYDIISTTIKRESEVTYSYYWKVKEIRTYQVTTQKTYLRSNNELLGQNQHKRVVAILIKKTRQNLDTVSATATNNPTTSSGNTAVPDNNTEVGIIREPRTSPTPEESPRRGEDNRNPSPNPDQRGTTPATTRRDSVNSRESTGKTDIYLNYLNQSNNSIEMSDYNNRSRDNNGEPTSEYYQRRGFPTASVIPVDRRRYLKEKNKTLTDDSVSSPNRREVRKVLLQNDGKQKLVRTSHEPSDRGSYQSPSKLLPRGFLRNDSVARTGKYADQDSRMGSQLDPSVPLLRSDSQSPTKRGKTTQQRHRSEPQSRRPTESPRPKQSSKIRRSESESTNKSPIGQKTHDERPTVSLCDAKTRVL
ncbi:hypothetical protein PGTUg99_031860 [Puccinia graminis f. sp. tritici]|uniref:Uncharacterized protein n=1 Tax=Puccinia graminis f. sp. tritici TaxID=56615 RepID=A0A5B0PPN9_PUCGR|nr:hypothetical protein PGTUg99_031860 [Puccinia graminis f. sp. tritici]